MTRKVAILSASCRFAEADSPEALWQNLCDGRRSFRPIPSGRLNLQEYTAECVGDDDAIPRIPAGLISDWQFDREGMRIPQSTFAASDLTHWLALDCARSAVARIGGPERLQAARTAVIIGNTLTGEFTRAQQIRLRLPYIARRISEVLGDADMPADQAEALRTAICGRIAGDFPVPDGDSLAGALANTIAGRIANYFDLGGGAWTVDGACAASLLAINDACTRIDTGQVDFAIVGGVDLSLDPFELVGFARAGALCLSEMRVFDRRAAGFWPGEGCGIVVLASAAAAAKADLVPLGWIAGWGAATDGAGSMTRPTESGQRRAIAAAWQRAGYAPATASLFEAHGTGTPVGDPIEIAALAAEIGRNGARIPLGSVKANIGHCKAAAGIAGFIKTLQSLNARIVAPHVHCEDPHPAFGDTGNRLAPATVAEITAVRPRAGISAFGFGGINTHVVIEAAPAVASFVALPRHPVAQSAELFLFAGRTPSALAEAIAAMRIRAGTLSHAEFMDAAATCAAQASPDLPFRASCVARDPTDLMQALGRLCDRPARPVATAPRLGFVYPGQAAPVRGGLGALAALLPDAVPATVPPGAGVETAHAQPAIFAASDAGTALLAAFGLRPQAVLGHSLGEIAALSAAGVLSSGAARALVAARGRIMSVHGKLGGQMVQVAADVATIDRVGRPEALEIACLNGPRDTVLAGPSEVVAQWSETAAAAGLDLHRLHVSHAFHSAAFRDAEAPFRAVLGSARFAPPRIACISSVTATCLSDTSCLPDVLAAQLTSPVRFSEALALFAQHCDVIVDIGPGRAMSRLAAGTGVPVATLDVGSDDLEPVLIALAALWERGAVIDTALLYRHRAVRPLGPAPQLLANPCGETPGAGPIASRNAGVARARPPAVADAGLVTRDALAAVTAATAQVTGLPQDLIDPQARFLDDLHLNSLSVGKIVKAAAAALGVAMPDSAGDLAGGTVADLAALLDTAAPQGPDSATPTDPLEGAAPWIAEYVRVWQPVANVTAAPLSGRMIFGPLPEAMVEGTDYAIVNLRGQPPTAATLEMLRQAVTSARTARHDRILILHDGLAVSGFARTLVQEGVFAGVTVLEVVSGAPSLAVQPVDPRGGFAEWRLRPDGCFEKAEVRYLPLPQKAVPPHLGPDDLILVTGGAKGIGAEAALRVAAETGAALILTGRSAVEDAAVVQTLARARGAGRRATYLQVDLTCTGALRAALAATGMCPTAVLHAAGVNVPARFDDLSQDDLRRVLAPKLGGLEEILGALDPAAVRLCIGFGSVIGAFGLPGEAHYALANDMMSARLAEWGQTHGVATLSLDWSIWAGAGMGERLGAVDALARKGVTALPLTAALDRLTLLLRHAAPGARMVVTSRFGLDQTVVAPTDSIADGRFLQRQRCHFPGVEAIFDSDLTQGSDPWLDDHVVDGVCVVPSVILIEAMAQAAHALTGTACDTVSDVQFDRACVVDTDGLTLRTCVVRRDDGSVLAVIRSSVDGFRADCARAVLSHLSPTAPAPAPAGVAQRVTALSGTTLYDALCFNRGRFARIAGLDSLTAFAVTASLARAERRAWFGPFESQVLALGDPGDRDAGLHMLQAAVPQLRVLPVGVDRIEIFRPQTKPTSVVAVEVRSDDRSFVFDILWHESGGAVTERWQGARFKTLKPRAAPVQHPQLLAVAVQRAIKMKTGRTDIAIAVAQSGPQEARRHAVLDRLGCGDGGHRGDGAPLAARQTGRTISLSHDVGLTLGVAGTGCVTCDCVAPGSDPGGALRPADEAVAQQTGVLAARFAAAALWAGRECTRKAGLPLNQPLVPVGPATEDSLTLRAADFIVLCHRWGSDGCIAVLCAPGMTAVKPQEALVP
jgi:enediyne polyketide synthase